MNSPPKMLFKIGDMVVPIIADQEQTRPQKLKKIHTKDSIILYELADGKSYESLAPGNKLTWALATLRHGYSVIPIEPGGKRPPIISEDPEVRFSWKHYQTTPANEKEVKGWFKKWPDCNYGIVTGKISGIAVLDIDNSVGESYVRDQSEKRDEDNRKIRDLPTTPTAVTGKGKHLHFEHPGFDVKNFARKVNGLDLRGDGGYVVAPGSWHSERHTKYNWQKDKTPWHIKPVPMPIWLLDLLQEKKKKPKPRAISGSKRDPIRATQYWQYALRNAANMIRQATDGAKHDTLIRASRLLGGYIAGGIGNEYDARILLEQEIASKPDVRSFEAAQKDIWDGIAHGKGEPITYEDLESDRENYAKQFELPPLPNSTASSLLDQKYQELKDVNEQDLPQRFQETVNLLVTADPFTAEIYINKLANDGIATKTVTRKAIKQSAREQKAQPPPQRPNPTHDELGDRWIAQHSGLTIFVYERWYRYKDGIWQPTEQVESETWDVLVCAKSEGVRPTKNVKASVIDYMQNQCKKADATMNSNPDLACMQNGVFDLKKLELIEYDPTHYLTSRLSFGYDSGAKCSLWEETILDWMSGNELSVLHLQEAIGYSLTGETKYQMAWMLAGEGSNGKDTLLEILRALVGESHHELDLSALSVNDRYGLANLPNKKLVTCAEAVSDKPVADAYLKKIISGEPMEARMPYGRPFNFRPVCKIWWSVNDKPLVTDQTKGYWRRWTVIPFSESYLGREDFDLEDKLKKELPGIFNWAITGLQRLQKNDQLSKVPIFTEATEEYRHKTSVESLFIEEACDVDLLTDTAIKTIYGFYKAYCIENGYRPKGKRRFTDDMVRLGHKRSRLGGGIRALEGIRVRDQVQWD